MKSFYNSGTGVPTRSPLERFKRPLYRPCNGRRRCASGCSLQFRQQIDGARGADADRCVVCPEPAFLSAPSPAYLPQLPSLRFGARHSQRVSGAVVSWARYQSVLVCVPKCPDFARPVECPGAKCPICAEFRAEFISSLTTRLGT